MLILLADLVHRGSSAGGAGIRGDVNTEDATQNLPPDTYGNTRTLFQEHVALEQPLRDLRIELGGPTNKQRSAPMPSVEGAAKVAASSQEVERPADLVEQLIGGESESWRTTLNHDQRRQELESSSISPSLGQWNRRGKVRGEEEAT